MTTYEEFMIIINAAMLIIAILVYIDRKNGTKNSRPPFQKQQLFSLKYNESLEATLWSELPFCTFIINHLDLINVSNTFSHLSGFLHLVNEVNLIYIVNIISTVLIMEN